MLIALAGGVALLLALGAFAASPIGRGARGARVVTGGCAAVAAALAVLGVAALASGEPAGAALALPVGPIRGRSALALDGLSAWFLVPVGIAGAACALAAVPSQPPAGRGGAALPLTLAGLALCLAAADGAVLLCGLGLVFLVVAAGGDEAPGAAPALSAAGLLCLGAALGLLGGAATDFGTLRSLPPDGWRAAALPFLGVAGAASVAAALPLAGRRAAGGEEWPLLAAAMPLAAVYVLARLLPDLGGPAQPSWWGLPLLAGGGAGAVAAALLAASAEETDRVPVLAGASVAGLCAMALGAAMVFRGADLAALAALAAGGALLLAAGGGLSLAALALAAALLARSAGSARLDRLGGLARFMPVAALAAALPAAAGVAMLPLLPGFAGFWALLQALVSGWRLGGAALPLFCAAALALAGAAAAVLAAAMLRFFAAAFLGRPRTPRAAGARDAAGLARWALLVPVAPMALLGLVPGWALAGGEAALAVVAGRAPLPTRGAGLALAEGGAAYAPLLLAALLALSALALAALVMRLAPPGGAARGPAWEGGFMAPPPHLPFGEPSTQPSAAGFAEPLRRFLGLPPPSTAGRRRRLAFARPRWAAAAGAAPAPSRAAGAALGGALLVLAAALAALAVAGGGG